MTEHAPNNKYHWSLQTTQQSHGCHEGYLVIRLQDEPQEGVPRYGWKLDIPGKFNSHQELTKAGADLFRKFLNGGASPPVVEEKEKFRGYRIVGKARFLIHELKWEPLLELKKIDEPNKGKKQVIGGLNTAFARNLFPYAEGAAVFARDFGKSMVLGTVRGLEI